MAIADDFSVAVDGDIRYTGSTANYLVIEFHRFLQDLADDAARSGDDILDITSTTPSARSTDEVIALLPPYNIDDTAAEHLYAGSISQTNGDEVYSGLQVLGAVNDTDTQLIIMQDNELYQFTTTPASPFWGDQSTGGYNGNTISGILMRCLIKSRQNGADINGKRIRVQARHWGDSYDFFNVTLGLGESVAAISTIPDAQNDTDQGTVTAYTHVTNTEGFQLIDLDNGNGDREYYSKWTVGVDTSGDSLKGMWEFIKDLTGNGTAKTIHGINGELFLGITHSWAYDGESGGPFSEDEIILWGTDITYNTLSGGTFSVGDYVTIGNAGAAGKVLYDNGSTNMIVALEDPSITLITADVITELGGGGVTAAINVTILNNFDSGGEGVLLALDDDGADGNHYIQLISGAAPVNNLPLRGRTSSATALVDLAPTPRTVPKVMLGSYTGSLIGAYGIGVLPADVVPADSLEDLSGTTQDPPNKVTLTLSGIETDSEVRILNLDDVINFNKELVGSEQISGGVIKAVIIDGGSGYTNGAQVLTVVGGTGTPATINVTVAGNVVTSVDSIAAPGSYTVNPPTPATTTGGGGSGCTLRLTVAGTFNYQYDFDLGYNVAIIVFHLNFKEVRIEQVLPTVTSSIPIQQNIDRAYSNP